jgi:hypothetical protein
MTCLQGGPCCFGDKLQLFQVYELVLGDPVYICQLPIRFGI